MSNPAQIENRIEALSHDEFLVLMEWMEDRHLQLLSEDGFESPEMEAAMLRGLEGPRQEWNAAMRGDIRAGSWIRR